MRIFVTGVNGQVGHDVMNEALRRGHVACGSDITEDYGGAPDESPVTRAEYRRLDITDRAAVSRTIAEIKPDAIIHCAAWTAVDAAEDPANQETIRRINANGIRYLAEAAKAIQAKMLYLSTDYVFDGKGERPWQPDDRQFGPLNFYGQTKLEGEQAVADLLTRFLWCASPGFSASAERISSKRCLMWGKRMIQCASSAIKSARRPTRSIYPACLWI